MRALALLAVGVLLSGCGTYQITYRQPSQTNHEVLPVREEHAHGFGPLLVGGGGLFFLMQGMSPALVDYTGAKQVESICPHGFYEVTQAHEMAQNAQAAFISWLIVFNVYHKSNVDWTCSKPPEEQAAAPTQPAPL